MELSKMQKAAAFTVLRARLQAESLVQTAERNVEAAKKRLTQVRVEEEAVLEEVCVSQGAERARVAFELNRTTGEVTARSVAEPVRPG